MEMQQQQPTPEQQSTPQQQSQQQSHPHVLSPHNPGGQNFVYILQAPRESKPYPTIAGRATGIGVTTIIISILTYIFQGVAMAVSDPFGFGFLGPTIKGHAGFWCGSVFLVAGICFCVAAQGIDSTRIIVAVVAAALSLVFSVILCALSIEVVAKYRGLFSALPVFSVCAVVLALLAIVEFSLSVSILSAGHTDYSANAKVAEQPAQTVMIQGQAAPATAVQ